MTDTCTHTTQDAERQFAVLAAHLPCFLDGIPELMAEGMDRRTAELHCANAQLQAVLHTLQFVPGVASHLNLLHSLRFEFTNALCGRESPITIRGVREGRARPRMSIQREAVAMQGATAVLLLSRAGAGNLKQCAAIAADLFNSAGLLGREGRPLTAQTLQTWHDRYMTDDEHKQLLVERCDRLAGATLDQAKTLIATMAKHAAEFF